MQRVGDEMQPEPEGERETRDNRHSRLLSMVARLSDADLLHKVHALAGRERAAMVELVAHLAELDARKLYLGEGHGSLFSYCTGALGLAEHAAYNRIEAARASRRFPVILDMLADGSLNLSTVRLLAPHLQPENFEAVVAQAKGKSKREVETLVARLAPRPDVAASVRRLPTPAQPLTVLSTPTQTTIAQLDPVQSAAGPLATAPPAQPMGSAPAVAADHGGSSEAVAPERPPQRPVVSPLAPGRYRVQFTIGEATHEKLRRARDLLRREIPDGDPGAIFDRALTLLLEDVARKKLAAMSRPPSAKRGDERPALSAGRRSRHIPARVRRAVWLRDGGRCAFVAPSGRRCTERAFLEFHHREPYAIGGEATVANVSLRCRGHNGYESDLVFRRSVPAARGVPPGAGATGCSPVGPHPEAARANSPRGELGAS